MKTITPKRLLTVLLVVIANITISGQSSSQLIEEGLSAIQKSKYENASKSFTKALANDTLSVQLQALSGLLKIATYQNDVSTGDSLLYRGEKIADSINDPFVVANFTLAKGEYYRTGSKFDLALSAFRSAAKAFKLLKNKKIYYADALQYIGLTYEQTSMIDSALHYVELAKTIYQSEGDTTSLKYGLFLNSLASAHFRSNHVAQAKANYEKAAKIVASTHSKTAPDIAMILGNLAAVYRAEGSNTKGIECTKRALQINRANNDEIGQSFNYYSLGVFSFMEGDYGRTRDYMQACIRVREKLLGANHYRLIGPYDVLGIALEQAGDYEASRKSYQKARGLIAQNFKVASLQEGHNLENIALSFQASGQLDSAILYLHQADEIYLGILPPKSIEMANHYLTYGSILFNNEQVEDAEQYILKSITILDELALQDSLEYAYRFSLLGKIYADRSDWKKADGYFSKSIEQILTGDSNGLDIYLTTPDALQLIQAQVDYYFKKYQQLQDEKYLQQFQNYSAIYIKVAEELRRQFIDPYTKSALIKKSVPVYKSQIGNYVNLYTQSKSSTYIEDIFAFAEYSRATMLRDMQDGKLSNYARVDQKVLFEEEQLKQKLTELNAAYFEHPDSIELSTKLFEAKEALSEFVEQTKISNPKYYELQYSQGIVTILEIQSKLQPQEILVEYLFDDTAYYAIVIGKDEVAFKQLAKKSDIDQLIQLYRKDIVSRNKKATNDTGSHLYKLLWAPLGISPHSKVVVVPVSALFYLNIETLPTSKDSYLIQEQTISYALSANIYYSKKGSSNADGMAIAVAPGFENDVKNQYQSALDSLEEVDTSFLYTVRQPWSVKLANKLKTEYKNKAYIGKEAVESNIKSRLSQGSILYFGTHAIADELDPLRSRLVLTKEIGDQKEDGYLHAYEIYGLELNSDLTILSACESGVGRLQEGEGMISLAHSIHYAGCASTVMSLWQVDEQTNTSITDRFLENIATGQLKSAALRNAKLAYLQSAASEASHPFYWGGMILMGDDGKVALSKKLPWRYHLFIGGMLLFSIGGWLYFSKRKD